ncbi:hypothetical protein PtA15_6A536 [Puccinia triticina]|uniref:Uncharacterized protein n=1 Tax=Puccinia triticina TaxID=208348 RepID=A0ABY7CPI9_9BASI|nr:uncharacterized protein PtA15_6A536 [Puccinia triticina]WAQ85907.1 hypothetical protein PtA15_6A536 [Puccinia triticina]WAR55801.1 hypothetical protein PtB15_6B544 [Puccinia triticina]
MTCDWILAAAQLGNARQRRLAAQRRSSIPQKKKKTDQARSPRDSLIDKGAPGPAPSQSRLSGTPRRPRSPVSSQSIRACRLLATAGNNVVPRPAKIGSVQLCRFAQQSLPASPAGPLMSHRHGGSGGREPARLQLASRIGRAGGSAGQSYNRELEPTTLSGACADVVVVTPSKRGEERWGWLPGEPAGGRTSLSGRIPARKPVRPSLPNMHSLFERSISVVLVDGPPTAITTIIPSGLSRIP